MYNPLNYFAILALIFNAILTQGYFFEYLLLNLYKMLIDKVISLFKLEVCFQFFYNKKCLDNCIKPIALRWQAVS